MGNRRAGIIFVKVDGALVEAKGNFSYNLGYPQKETMAGASGIQGYKETEQEAFIEGEITDSQELDFASLVQGDELTVTLELNNGKTIVLNNAWFSADGTGNTEEANLAVKWSSSQRADEMR